MRDGSMKLITDRHDFGKLGSTELAEVSPGNVWPPPGEAAEDVT
jgi:hypothetical protein